MAISIRLSIPGLFHIKIVRSNNFSLRKTRYNLSFPFTTEDNRIGSIKKELNIYLRNILKFT